MLNIQIAARSRIGSRERNEDDLRTGSHDGISIAVLSDGAGGHRNGAIAADLVVRVVMRALQSQTEIAPSALHAAVHDAHELLLRQERSSDDRARMHATLVAVWIDAERASGLWSHVGDSRLYLVRRGRILHVTRDDSAVQELVDAGLITAEAARHHPIKSRLVCAMGGEDAFTAHTIEKAFPLEDGDAFLLCTDGWWENLTGDDIEDTLLRAHGPDDWLAGMEALIQRAAEPDQDNHTAIAVWVGDMPTR